MPINNQDILWAMSMTYDWMDDRHYDESLGPVCKGQKTPLVVYRKDEMERIWRGKDRDGNRIGNEVVNCNLCKGIAHEDEGYFIDGELVCCGCHEEELFYRKYDATDEQEEGGDE